ncbi:hypothetical protein NQ318_011777 [Aromia moschata]|uniref:CRAL-TRIO domain-containing protein n=1 Tax=Aromia moschata TaxID=1265417 RepID=A0AAV8XZI5_9CUCU|nr:hypothetical protein NQ318_011777 [Aromia moschata]
MIVIICLANIDVRTMEMLDVVGVDDVWIESLLLTNPQVAEKGLCVIFDIANYPWNMIKWFTPDRIKLSLKKMQSLPFKDYRFHFVNNATVIHAVIKIIWPFLPEHFKQMIKFHFDNRTSLFEHIDPKVLPLEYGGTNNLNYNELWSKLYDRNEEISSSFKLYRTVSI